LVSNGIINISLIVGVQPLVCSPEKSTLMNLNVVFHQELFSFGTNGVECNSPSARATRVSRTKSIGKSGLLRAVRPIIA